MKRTLLILVVMLFTHSVQARLCDPLDYNCNPQGGFAPIVPNLNCRVTYEEVPVIHPDGTVGFTFEKVNK